MIARALFVVAYLFLFTIIAGMLTPAQADHPQHSLQFLCCSVHHQNADNEVHMGIFYERQLGSRWRGVVGTFQNSLDNRSFVVALQREWALSEHWDAQFTFGIATGYGDLPAAVPSVSYRDRLRLYVIPGVVYAVGFKILEW